MGRCLSTFIVGAHCTTKTEIAMPVHSCVDLPRRSKLRRVTRAPEFHAIGMSAQLTLHRVHEEEQHVAG